MRCLFPITIYAPKIDYSTGEVSKSVPQKVPCGKCFYCLATKRGQWISRLEEEKKASHSSHFITLTYNDEYMPYDKNGNPMVSKRDVQLFLHRLRKRLHSKIRYLLVSEYGPHTQRPHYHAVVFNLSVVQKSENMMTYTDLADVQVEVQRSWSHYDRKTGLYYPIGYSSVYPLNDRMISYVCKYHALPKDLYTPENFEKPFSLVSRRPGLGISYIDNSQSFHSRNIFHWYYPSTSGTKRSLPRYYSERLYDDYLRYERGLYLADFNDRLDSQLSADELEKKRKRELAQYYDYERKQIKSLRERHKI